MFSRAKPGLFKVLFSAFLVASVFGFVYLGQQVYENSDYINFSAVAQTAAVSNSVSDNVFCFFSGVFGFPCKEDIVYVPAETESLVENNLPPETPVLVPTYRSENNDTSGNVGIGTTSPNGRFHIDSGSDSSPVVQTFSTGGAGRAVIGLTSTISSNNFFTGSGVSSLNIRSAEGTNINLGPDNGLGTASPVLTITSSSNVGIGTVSPASLLHVQSSADGEIARFQRTGGSNIPILQISGEETNNLIRFTETGAVAGHIAFNTGAAERLRITSSGNIGIGTTTPDDILTAYSTGANEGLTISNYLPGLTFRDLSLGEEMVLSYNGNDSIVGRFKFTKDGSDLVTITDAGNVGIGTTSPDLALGVVGGIRVIQSGSPDKSLRILHSGDVVYFDAYNGASNAEIQFRTGNGSQNALRIDELGSVLIGGTSFSSGSRIKQFEVNTNAIALKSSASATTLQYHNEFHNSNGLVGSITTNGSATSYNTSSDRRVKDNIDYTTLGLDDLMQLPVRDFSFLADEAGEITTGFIAQELYEIFPWAVTVNGDNGIDPLASSTDPWSVDYGRLTPLLAKSIQDLNLKLEDLASSTAATSTLNAEGEEEPTFVGQFFARLVEWFADATNGIGTMMASVFQASDMICVDDECLTADDIRQLKDGNNLNSPVDVVEVDDGDNKNGDGSGDVDAGVDGEDTPPATVLGCTDSVATNYSQDATEDDGSCEYGDAEQPEVTPVLGCTDTEALNYDSSATEDDDTCEYEEVPAEEPIDPVEPAEEPVQDDEEGVVEDTPFEGPATI